MHYFKYNIGDFDRETRHLTRVERSIYRDLLDLYYSTETQIVLDVTAVCRLVIARTDEERTSVDQVLNEFFTKTPTGWYQSRCEREIAEYRANQSQKAIAGKASAAAKQAKKEQALNGASTSVEQPNNGVSTNHKPLTINQETEDQKTLRPSLREDADTELSELLAGIPADLLRDYKKVRKAKKQALTARAVRGLIKAGQAGGKTLIEVLEICCAESWSGYNHTWPRSSDRGMIVNGSQAREQPKTVGGILALEAMKS